MAFLVGKNRFFFFLLVLLSCVILVVLAGNEEDCQNWADVGECEKNPAYMLNHCAKACRRVTQMQQQQQEKLLKSITSVYDLKVPDIDGNLIDFDTFRGQVVVLTNVASYCGYTESHYQGLVQLWSQLGSSGNFHLLAFPCNQFGNQEPGTAQEIKEFAQEKGVQFTMMSKVSVNGPQTDLVYVYLKKHAKNAPNTIQWNFATYFVIEPNGDVTAYNGVEPMQLQDTIADLMARGEEL